MKTKKGSRKKKDIITPTKPDREALPRYLTRAGLRYTEAITAIKGIAKVKDTRAQGLFTEMKEARIIAKDSGGFWRLAA